ncbi:MAG: hypothetical protein V2A54_16500 [Bacteroidota bacterium]
METEFNDILQKLFNQEITPDQAQKLVLVLFVKNISHPPNEFIALYKYRFEVIESKYIECLLRLKREYIEGFNEGKSSVMKLQQNPG